MQPTDPPPSRAKTPWHHTPKTVIEKFGDDGSPKRLLIFLGESVWTKALGDGGTLTIGRAEEADLRLDAPSISRLHARLHLGIPIQVEDLGSANGTWLGGRQLQRGELLPLVVGNAVRIGDATLVLQRQHVLRARPRRLFAHDWFEARLEEACAWPPATGLAVVRLRLEGAASPAQVEQALVEALLEADVVAAYGPGEYEVMLASADPARAESLISQLRASCVPGASIRTGVAYFGRDGRSSDELLEVACRQLAPHSAQGHKVVVRSPEMERLFDVARRIAHSPLSVVLLGETGVGKEVLAEEIHRASPRRDRPFHKLNCAAFQESLVEAELFGVEKGAFTGAERSRPGLLESAAGGTVMLDEVGELPLSIQAKLLRALEQKEVRRLGENRTRSIDVRFLAATNRDLEAQVRSKQFREDLYFRLAGITLAIPPLRARSSEIEPLARLFIAEHCRDARRPEVALAPEALAVLQAYSWPGNIRELKNTLERAVVLCGGSHILPEHLPLEKMRAPLLPKPRPGGGALPASLAGAVEQDAERARVLEALEKCAGNQTLAAKLLGVSRRTLLNRLDTYAIPRPRKSHRQVPDPADPDVKGPH